MSTLVQVVEGHTIVSLVGPGALIALAAAERAETEADRAESEADEAAASAVASAASAAAALVSEENAGAYSTAVDLAVAGLDISDTLPLQAVSRAALAAFTLMTAGRQAFLSEAGRAGVFKWSTADNSANVTADPNQALYVAPASDTDGSSGAWVRVMESADYELSWWGVTEAVADGAPMLENALETLLPDGARLFFDGTVNIQTNVLVDRSNITLEGRGYTSWLKFDQSVVTVFDMLQFRKGSNIACRNFRMTGKETGDTANPACLFFGGDLASGEAEVGSNFEASGLWISDTSLAIVASCTSDASEVNRLKNVRIFNNHISSNRQGVSMFGTEDSSCVDNIIDMVDSAPNNFSAPIRVIGSKNTMIARNIGRGTGEHAIFGGSLQRQSQHIGCEDIYIIDNQFTNCPSQAVYISDCHGELIVSGNRFEGDITSTGNTIAVNLDAGDTLFGVTTVLHRAIIKNNEFIGYHTCVKSRNTNNRHMIIEGNTFIGTASALGSGLGDLYFAEFGSFQLCDIFRNRVLQPTGGAIASEEAVRLLLVGGIVRVFDNDLPEGTTTLFASPGTHTEEGTLADNRVYPAGSYAAATS